MWEDENKKALWDHKKKMNIEKQIEKYHATYLIERHMKSFK